MFKRPLLLIAALIQFFPAAQAQQLSGTGRAALDTYLAEAIERTRIPGMVALIVGADGVLYEEAFGLMDSAGEVSMRRDAIFRLASMTKPVTSTAIMLLVEEGRVALDAPVSSYLPALAAPQVFTDVDLAAGTYNARPAAGEITVRQLLTHTSGLGYTFTSDILAALLGNTPGGRATALPLLFDPGTQWHYGESTRVLGEIVEAVSGQELFAFLSARLLGPLGMAETSFDVPAALNARVVTVHRSDGTTLVETPNPAGAITAPHQGDGGLSGTARDYARFVRLFLNGGRLADGTALLQPDTVALMTADVHMGEVKVQTMVSTNPLVSADFPLGAGEDTYVLGFQRTARQVPGMRAPGSLSWAGIFNTEFWIDPANGVGAVLLMQYLPFYDPEAIEVLQGFERRVYQALER